MKKLRRTLGLFEATFYGISLIIGAGIFALIGPASGLAGNAVWLSFLIGAFVATFTGLSYAELVAMYPKSAGEYIYVKRAYHNDYWAFLIGWLLIFTGVTSAATVSLGFASYFSALVGTNPILSALGLLVVLSFINFKGIRESSKFNIVLNLAALGGLAIIIIVGLRHFGSVNYFESPTGIDGILAASTLIFFAYLGFEDVVNMSEETKSPRKFVPIALMASILVATVFYILTSISAVSLVDWRLLSASKTPLAIAAAKSLLGDYGSLILSISAIAATVSTVLVILTVASRMIYGMSRETALPKSFSKIHKKTRTPYVAIWHVMIFSMLFVLFGNITLLANLTSFGLLLTFFAVNASVIWLRYTKPNIKRRFKAPLNIGKYPLNAFLGSFTCFFLLFQFDMQLVTSSLAILVIGTGIFEARRRKLF